MNAMKLQLSLAALAALASCSSGLGTGGPNDDQGVPAAAAATGLGLDLGFDLTSSIQGVAAGGAVIPGVNEGEERRIAFYAFATAAPANNADGSGTPLTRDAAGPADSNGESDVFLLAFEDDTVDAGPLGPQPKAFSRALVNTFRHSRCVNCHAMGTLAGPGETPAFPNMPHPGGMEPFTDNTGCSDCHNGGAVPFLAGVEWRAPLEADGNFDFRGNTLQELAMKAQSVPFDEHLLNDGRVTWAISSGDVPFVTPRAGGNAGTSGLWDGVEVDQGAVPISFEVFRAQLETWRDNGFQVTATEAIKDVVLLSRANGSNNAANGGSINPVLTWVPNPAYDPANPSAQPAGEVVVAFDSDASNLIPGGTNFADIYRTRTPLFIGRDPATGAALADGVDLDYAATSIELVSESATGGNANGSSSGASMDASGDEIVFSSSATNLVSGFSNGNGTDSDVYYRDVVGGTTVLVSATTAGGSQGGDGDSRSGTISPTGRAVAFTSEAADLIAGDTNGVGDVFYTRIVGGIPTDLRRADVTSAGEEGVGGSSIDPDVVVLPSGDVVVAFQSQKTNLANSPTTPNVFVHEEGVTTMLSQIRIGGSSTPGNDLSFDVGLAPTGQSAVYSTFADNLDTENPSDDNGDTDVILVDLATLRASGNVIGQRLSVDSLGKTGVAGAATGRLEAFIDSQGLLDTTLLGTFRSTAENLGSTRQDLIAKFLPDDGSMARTDFAADVEVGPAPLTVTFADASSGDPSAWSWNFGDGTTSTEQNPTHTFTDPGDYSVSLTVTRPGVGTDTVVKEGFIRALTPLELVGFSADNLSGPTTLSTAFSAVINGSLDGIQYLWDFGDGATSTEAAPAHNYTAVGTFSVTLTINGLAGSDSLTRTNYITTTAPSGANFSFNRLGLRTEFNDSSTGSPTSRRWDFGDGTILLGNQTNPTHDYATNGTYVVTLTVDGPGGMDMRTLSVTTNARPFAEIRTLLGSNGCTSCHSGGSPSGGLLINASASVVHDELVNVPAEGNACDNMGRIRVIPFNASSSLLLQTLLPGACNSGSNMNIGNFNATERLILADWINDGATEF